MDRRRTFSDHRPRADGKGGLRWDHHPGHHQGGHTIVETSASVCISTTWDSGGPRNSGATSVCVATCTTWMCTTLTPLIPAARDARAAEPKLEPRPWPLGRHGILPAGRIPLPQQRRADGHGDGQPGQLACRHLACPFLCHRAVRKSACARERGSQAAEHAFPLVPPRRLGALLQRHRRRQRRDSALAAGHPALRRRVRQLLRAGVLAHPRPGSSPIRGPTSSRRPRQRRTSRRVARSLTRPSTFP